MRRNRWTKIMGAVFAFVFSTALLSGNASDITGQSVFAFNYKNGGGYHTGLTVDASGNIWGISQAGGAYGYGNVFELTRNANGQWTEIVLYSFTGGSDGGTPFDDDRPLIDPEGNLYGTTLNGGTDSGGTVFKLTHGSNGWQESVLWNFTCGNDGCGPEASLVSDSAGDLYGTTYAGGPGGEGYGTVFELLPDGTGNWKETTLHVFSGSGRGDGAGPTSSLIFDRSGNLYGATSAGGFYSIPQGCDFAGFYGCGVIFKLTQGVVGEWEEQVVYAFQGGNDGALPNGQLAFDASGNIYGVAEFAGDLWCNFIGCGTVFRLAAPTNGGSWTFTTLHIFTGNSDGFSPRDGADPSEGVIVDKTGVVYGTTFEGGNSQCKFNYSTGCGTVFRITPTMQGMWNFEELYSFLGKTDGGQPSKIVFVDSTPYVPTGVGGSSSNKLCSPVGCGTIFQLTTTSQ